VNINDEDKYYNFKLQKSVVDKTVKVIGESVVSSVESVVSNTAVGGATAAAVTTWMKTTGGMAPIPRAVGLGAVTGITAASTKIGIEVGKTIVDYHLNNPKNNQILEDNDNTPSPKDDSFNMSSVLEDTELLNPLIKLLRMSLTLNVFTLILIFLFIWLIFNNYIFNKYIDKISKYLPKFVKWNKDGWVSKTSDNYILYLFIFTSILLIYIVLVNILINSHVIIVMGDYINGNSSILLGIQSLTLLQSSKHYTNCKNQLVKKYYNTTATPISFNHLSEIDNYELRHNNLIQKTFSNIQSQYNYIYILLSNNNLSLIEKQIKIEESLQEQLEKDIHHLLSNKNKLLHSSIGIQELLKLLISLDRDITDFKNNNLFLNKKVFKHLIINISNTTIIAVLFTNIIPFCIKHSMEENQNITTLFIKIGKELYNSYLNDEWNKIKVTLPSINENINKDDYLKDLKTKLSFDENTENFLSLGSSLSEYVSLKSEIFKIITVRIDKKRSNRIIIPHKKLNDNIANHFGLIIGNYPMICRPLNWEVVITDKNITKSLESNMNYSIKTYGGFLSNIYKKNNFIQNSIENIGVTKLINQKVISTINYLSNTELTINIPVLKIIFKLLESNNLSNLITTYLHPDTKNLFNLSVEGYKNKGKIKLILQHNSKFYQDSTILYTAAAFSNLGNNNISLFLPYFIDFRGRLYPRTGLFSPQSSELARSLFKFKTGYKLNSEGLINLKKYTANCYGLDKLSHVDKVKWIDENWEILMNIGNNNDWNFIFKAKDPLLFLACIVELQSYLKDPNKFLSSLPIYLDATCSGLQHLSTMVQDSVLAKHVNLSQSENTDIPYDLYQIMANKINKIIDDLPLRDKNGLINLNINRKLVKTGIMTIPYGATIRGIADQIKSQFFIETFVEIDGKNKLFYQLTNNDLNKSSFELKLTGSIIHKLASIIYSILYNSHPTLNHFVNYLKSMNKLLKKLNLSTIWLSPSGIIVEQKYVKMDKFIFTSSVMGKRHSITYQKPNKDKININKQNAAIMPNITHTLDAANIALLVDTNIKYFGEGEKIDSKLDIITIHDCFASHANHSDILINNVKWAFIKLYANKDFVKDYHNFILNYILKSGFIIYNNKVLFNDDEIEIPNIPKFRIDFDIANNILGSKYFII
jgi:hypothetical protein